MDFCDYKNLSIGVYKLPEFSQVQDRNNENINSILSKFHKSMFGLKNKKENKCKFVEIVEFGQKLSNGSYTGLLKHFYHKTIDLCSKIEIYYHDNLDLIDFTAPSSSSMSQVAQIVDKPETKKIDGLSIITHNLQIFYQILIATFLIILTTKFFVYQNLKNRRFKLNFRFILSSYDRKTKKNFSKIGLILIFFELNLFIYFVLITNSIKTNKVIVDTDSILDSKEKILNTDKVSCWVKSEFDYDYADKSIPGSLMNKIFIKRFFILKEVQSKKYECSFLPKGSIVAQLNILQKIPISNFFFFMNAFILKFLFALIDKFLPTQASYIGSKNFNEFIFVFVLRKSLPEDLKKFIRINVSRKLENGFTKKYMESFENYFLSMIQENRRIYSSAEEYSQDFIIMDLCNYKNLSIGVYKLPEFNQVQDRNNENINAILIKFYKSLFGLKNKKDNKCKFVEIVEFGQKLSNGSYTGLLKHFYEKTIDLCSKTEIYYHDDLDLIDFTTPSTACVSQVAQLVGRPETKKIDGLSIITNNLQIFYQILIATFLIILTTKFFVYQNLKNRRFKLDFRFILSSYDRKTKKNFSKIGLILIFFELNLFIYFVLISNNIKTNKVIVDTDSILDSKEKILNTDKISCWVKSEFDYDFANKSEPDSFINKVFRKRIYSTVKTPVEKYECSFLPKGSIVAQLNLFRKIPTSKFFFFMNAFILKFLFALIGKFLPLEAAYMGNKNFHEFIFVFVFRKSLPNDLKQHLLKNFIRKLENGYLRKYVDSFEDYFIAMVKEDRRVYSSADEYSQDFIMIENVKFSYFEKSFSCLMIIYNFVFFFFLLNKVLNKLILR